MVRHSLLIDNRPIQQWRQIASHVVPGNVGHPQFHVPKVFELGFLHTYIRRPGHLQRGRQLLMLTFLRALAKLLCALVILCVCVCVRVCQCVCVCAVIFHVKNFINRLSLKPFICFNHSALLISSFGSKCDSKIAVKFLLSLCYSSNIGMPISSIFTTPAEVGCGCITKPGITDHFVIQINQS